MRNPFKVGDEVLVVPNEIGHIWYGVEHTMGKIGTVIAFERYDTVNVRLCYQTRGAYYVYHGENLELLTYSNKQAAHLLKK